MTEREFLEKALDELLYQAAPLAEKELAEGSETPSDDGIAFSENHNEKMQKVLKAYKRKQRLKKMPSYIKRAIVALVVLSITAAIGIAGVDAWRIKVLNLFMDKSETHSAIDFKEGTPDETSTQAQDPLTDSVLGYVPSGFKAENSIGGPDYATLYFVNGDKNFRCDMRPINRRLFIDTEGATTEKLTIKDREAVLSKKETVIILVWHSEQYSFVISGNIDEKEIIKIAENIKK